MFLAQRPAFDDFLPFVIWETYAFAAGTTDKVWDERREQE